MAEQNISVDISLTDGNPWLIYTNLKKIKRIFKEKEIFRIKEGVSSLELPIKNQIISLIDEDKKQRKFLRYIEADIIKLTLKYYYEIYQQKKDMTEFFFLAAATLDVEAIRDFVDKNKDKINQMRDSDSVIMFMLQYGDLKNDNFLTCIKILIEAGIDINKFNFYGTTPIEYICNIYVVPNLYNFDNLRSVAELFLKNKVYNIENFRIKFTLEVHMKFDLSKYNFSEMDQKTKLFYWIITKNITEFKEFKDITSYLTCDNGEHTLLNFAIKKSVEEIVEYLLEVGANPNQCTEWDKLTPLELARLGNNVKIIEILLDHPEIIIKQHHFENFIKMQGSGNDKETLKPILEWDKLQVDFTYPSSGNTHLHYAILFSFKEAIQKLLKHKSSLTATNKFGISVLDIIQPKDLEMFFDYCLGLDNRYSDLDNIDYKMILRFRSLINKKNKQELQIVSSIEKNKKLRHLIKHPIVNIFVNLKWFRARYYFWLVLFIQTLLFVSLGYFLYHLTDLSYYGYGFCSLITNLNIFLKSSVLIINNLHNRDTLLRFSFEWIDIHKIAEIVLIITNLLTFWDHRFCAFIYIEMAICLLLVAGYHQKLSKWSVMLQTVYKSFLILLFFFSIVYLALALGFHILMKNEDNDQNLFKTFTTSLFKTYLMSTGEISTDSMSSNPNVSFLYGFFIIFFFGICLVLVNFLIGVAITDIAKIENESEINSYKNLVLFMKFVDNVYNIKIFQKWLPNSLLFDKDDIYELDFFINKEKQFDESFYTRIPKENNEKKFNVLKIYFRNLWIRFKERFPEKLDNDCIIKIRTYCNTLLLKKM